MEICGIVAEYNPFHNGHRHQLDVIRETLGGGTGIVAAMSGDFCQRGEPAVLDKWTRAQIAVDAGVDVVVELPFAFATASAERFAAGGVALLNAAGVVSRLAFGAETDRLDDLESLAGVLAEESESFRLELKRRLESGSGFAAARASAVGALRGEAEASLLAQPNAILAVSYLVAIRRQQAKLRPLLVPRLGPGEHDDQDDGRFASASLIRKRVFDDAGDPGRLLGLADFLPAPSLAALIRAALLGRLGRLDNLFLPILGLLRAADEASIANIASMAPDLDRRLTALARDRYGAGDAERFVAAAATRAYPASRVRRALLHLLLQYTADDEARDTAPRALRVLAFGKRGRYVLKLMKRHARLPILSRSSDILEQSEPIRRALDVDLAAADLYALSIGQATRADFSVPAGPADAAGTAPTS